MPQLSPIYGVSIFLLAHITLLIVIVILSMNKTRPIS
uniref:ATP synthase F0 subunit 8 n=2 Tax=unclassified Physidae TaxID=1724862 RepID=A0A8F8X7Y0_9GAST|nr:ATP synthase F0 subunit 8 [Physidae sp. PE4]QYB18826.1 ATP synthase F0 subunit 8 [Physidae sp. P3S_19]